MACFCLRPSSPEQSCSVSRLPSHVRLPEQAMTPTRPAVCFVPFSSSPRHKVQCTRAARRTRPRPTADWPIAHPWGSPAWHLASAPQLHHCTVGTITQELCPGGRPTFCFRTSSSYPLDRTGYWGGHERVGLCAAGERNRAGPRHSMSCSFGVARGWPVAAASERFFFFWCLPGWPQLGGENSAEDRGKATHTQRAGATTTTYSNSSNSDTSHQPPSPQPINLHKPPRPLVRHSAERGLFLGGCVKA